MEEKRNDRAGVASTHREDGHVWCICPERTPLALDPLSGSAMTRMMFLATFMDRRGAVRFDNGVPISKKNLGKLLGLSPKMCRQFYDEAVASGCLIDTGNEWKVGRDVFYKGPLSEERETDLWRTGKIAVRLSVSGVRSLYRSARSVRNHKSLSYLFRVMPLANLRFNTLCYNPLEPDPANLCLLDLGTVSDMVGLGRNHSSYLRDLLSSATFRVSRVEQNAARCVPFSLGGDDVVGVMINPALYGNIECWSAKEIHEFFQVPYINAR